MPIPGVEQPNLLPIGDTLRLRRFADQYPFAFDWYQDPETVWLVDGVKTPYTWEKLGRMYHYLDKQGELYFIEVLEEGVFRPVGDVCFWKDDLPIVIGDPSCRGKGIGRKVIAALIQRGRDLGYDTLRVSEIYEYNGASRKCFESMGFRACEKTEDGSRYVLMLNKPSRCDGT